MITSKTEIKQEYRNLVLITLNQQEKMMRVWLAETEMTSNRMLLRVKVRQRELQ